MVGGGGLAAVSALGEREAEAGRPAVAAVALSILKDHEADPRRIKDYRQYTRNTMARWGLPHLADDAVAIMVELASNAVKASLAAQAAWQKRTGRACETPRVALWLALDRRRGVLSICVLDAVPGELHIREYLTVDAMQETGRGLMLVYGLTGGRVWVKRLLPGASWAKGKIVYAELEIAR